MYWRFSMGQELKKSKLVQLGLWWWSSPMKGPSFYIVWPISWMSNLLYDLPLKWVYCVEITSWLVVTNFNLTSFKDSKNIQINSLALLVSEFNYFTVSKVIFLSSFIWTNSEIQRRLGIQRHWRSLSGILLRCTNKLNVSVLGSSLKENNWSQRSASYLVNIVGVGHLQTNSWVWKMDWPCSEDRRCCIAGSCKMQFLTNAITSSCLHIIHVVEPTAIRKPIILVQCQYL